MGAMCDTLNIKHVTSNAGDSPQNGGAENYIGIIWAMIRIVLIAVSFGMSWWGEALNYCVFVYNFSPCYANPDCKSPWEMRYGRPPDLSRLHQFGEVGYGYVINPNQTQDTEKAAVTRVVRLSYRIRGHQWHTGMAHVYT